MTSRLSVLAVGALALSLAACRGSKSEEPPIHIIPDMDWQPRYDPQGESAFFEDGRSMRPIPAGTVARGGLKETPFHTGREGEGYVALAPVEVDEKLLARGQERYNIFCAPCHDQTGAGRGLVVQRGFHLPVDLSSEHTRTISDGEIFEIITKGVRNMPPYAAQIPEHDRWAIVSWVRVLQRSQHASVEDVPPQMRGQIEEAAQ